MGTFLVLEPAVFVEPMLLAIVVSPGPHWPTTASPALPRGLGALVEAMKNREEQLTWAKQRAFIGMKVGEETNEVFKAAA